MATFHQDQQLLGGLQIREHATVVDLCSKPTGGTYSDRKFSARAKETIAAVRDSVGLGPWKSVPRRSQELCMTRESVRRDLTVDNTHTKSK